MTRFPKPSPHLLSRSHLSIAACINSASLPLGLYFRSKSINLSTFASSCITLSLKFWRSLTIRVGLPGEREANGSVGREIGTDSLLSDNDLEDSAICFDKDLADFLWALERLMTKYKIMHATAATATPIIMLK